jgi:hypothetical protein
MPLLTPYSSSRCRARRSHTPFLRAPPPPRTAAAPRRASSVVFMLRHRDGEPPAPSCCPVSGLHPGCAHQYAPRPTMSRCRPRHCAERGRSDRAPVRAPARPHVRLSGRLGRWPMGHQPGRGCLSRLLAQRSCWPRAGFRPSPGF